MSDQMMHVLHVSNYDRLGKKPAVRVVLGCGDMADSVEGTLLDLGYCVWRTWEQNPTRTAQEVCDAQELITQVATATTNKKEASQ